jgi:hypothetical protein
MVDIQPSHDPALATSNVHPRELLVYIIGPRSTPIRARISHRKER